MRGAGPSLASVQRSPQGGGFFLRGTLLLAALALAGPVGAACGEGLPERGRMLAQGAGWQVAFVAVPGPLVANKPFALDLVVCPATAGAPLTRLGVDADMPAHKHGMNYRTVVKATGERRYRADGLLLHMPGRWRFLLELEVAPGQSIRLSREVEVP